MVVIDIFSLQLKEILQIKVRNSILFLLVFVFSNFFLFDIFFLIPKWKPALCMVVAGHNRKTLSIVPSIFSHWHSEFPPSRKYKYLVGAYSLI